MRFFMGFLMLFTFMCAAVPAEAQSRRGYYDDNGNWVSTRNAYRSSSRQAYRNSGERQYRNKVRSHRRRRNVLLGVGALGLVTGSGALSGIGLGGAAANHFIDDEHRDY